MDSAVDCQTICGRYRDCYDESYDVAACASRCRDDSSRDPDYRAKSDACDDCIGARSCSSATFSCAVQCGTIVP